MANLGKKNECQRFTISVGSPLVLEAAGFSIPYPLVIKVTPGEVSPGVYGTMLVEDRETAEGDFDSWPPGTVSVKTKYKLNGPVESLRITAWLVDGVCEVSQ